MAQVLVNGKSFSSADIVVVVNGIEVASVSNLSILETANKVNNPGFSREPVSRGRVANEYTCSIEMSYKDVLKLRNLVATRRLTDLPLFEVLAVMNNGIDVTRIRARNAEFLEDGIEVAEGDGEVKREYPIIIAGIDYD